MTELAGSSYVLRALELFAEYGDSEAVVDHDQRLSYADIANLTLGLAGLAAERGVGAATAVAMLVPDRPEWRRCSWRCTCLAAGRYGSPPTSRRPTKLP